MKRFFRTWLLAAILGSAGILAVSAQSNAANLDDAIQQTSKFIAQKITAPKVALLNVNSSSEDLTAYVIKELNAALGKNKNLVLIEKQTVDRALGAQNLKATGDVPDSSARQIGKSLGADFAVTGALVKTGDNYRFRTRVLNVSVTQIQEAADFSIRDSQKIAQLLGQAPAPAAAAAPAPAPAAAPAPTPAPAPAAAPVAKTAAGTYKVGDTGPAGGYIFYDKGNNSDGWQYLEAAPADLPRPLKATAESFDQFDLSERAVGKGKSNSEAIMKIAATKGGGFGWAAQACDEYAVNGYDDWFLPSRDELHYIYGNLYTKGLGNLRNEHYWSSTGSGSRNGHYFWQENFVDGRQDNWGGGNELRVRPVRHVAGR